MTPEELKQMVQGRLNSQLDQFDAFAMEGTKWSISFAVPAISAEELHNLFKLFDHANIPYPSGRRFDITMYTKQTLRVSFMVDVQRI